MADLVGNEASHLSFARSASPSSGGAVNPSRRPEDISGGLGNKREQTTGPPGWGLDDKPITYLRQKPLLADR